MNKSQFAYAMRAGADYASKGYSMLEKGRVAFYLAANLDRLYNNLYGGKPRGDNYVPNDFEKVEVTNLIMGSVPLWAGRGPEPIGAATVKSLEGFSISELHDAVHLRYVQKCEYADKLERELRDVREEVKRLHHAQYQVRQVQVTLPVGNLDMVLAVESVTLLAHDTYRIRLAPMK